MVNIVWCDDCQLLAQSDEPVCAKCSATLEVWGYLEHASDAQKRPSKALTVSSGTSGPVDNSKPLEGQ